MAKKTLIASQSGIWKAEVCVAIMLLLQYIHVNIECMPSV